LKRFFIPFFVAQSEHPPEGTSRPHFLILQVTVFNETITSCCSRVAEKYGNKIIHFEKQLKRLLPT
jgi:hypothetical protein